MLIGKIEIRTIFCCMYIVDKIRMMDGPSPFEFEADGNCNNEWKIWLRGFEIYAKANKLEEPTEKLNWMLHYAGTKVQTIFHTLPEPESEKQNGPFADGYVKQDEESSPDEYEHAVKQLCQFFEPKQNISYERHVFRQLRQNNNERIDMFLIRLRDQAERCEFGDQIDGNIRDQITSGCSSNLLRRKILERGDENLNNIIKMARIFEAVSKQQHSFGIKQESSAMASEVQVTNSDVCKIEANRRFTPRSKVVGTEFNGFCGRCGFKGHKSADEKCPARGQTCNRCGRKDHFARKCFLNEKNTNKRKPDAKTECSPPKKVKSESVQMLESVAAETSHTPQSILDEYDDVFCIESDTENSNKIWCTIGGIDMQIIVDSGTRYSIIDRTSWMDLKAKGIVTTHRQRAVDISFRSYGGHPLKFMGMFRCVIETKYKRMEADFYVADEFGKCLLGYETATKLGVLAIGVDIASHRSQINAVSAAEPLGKIKGVVVDIPIKANAKGVVQPYRRVPAPLEKLVDDKIDDMVRQDIIEKVNGVAKWISPVVVAPKGDNDVRICIDMRRANLAVDRENHPLPTIDDCLPQLNDAKVFSKLDVKQAFHQVE